MGGQGRAAARQRIPSCLAGTNLRHWALALAGGLVVNLNAWARQKGERACDSGVRQVAGVSGVGGACARVGVPGSVAKAAGRSDALALARVHVVGFVGRAGRNGEVANCRVVRQIAPMGRVGRALTGCRVPNGSAQTGLNLAALALAGGGVCEVGWQANRRVNALTVALGVQLLVARALVGTLTLARGGVEALE